MLNYYAYLIYSLKPSMLSEGSSLWMFLRLWRGLPTSSNCTALVIEADQEECEVFLWKMLCIMQYLPFLTVIVASQLCPSRFSVCSRILRQYYSYSYWLGNICAVITKTVFCALFFSWQMLLDSVLPTSLFSHDCCFLALDLSVILLCVTYLALSLPLLCREFLLNRFICSLLKTANKSDFSPLKCLWSTTKPEVLCSLS